MDVVLFSDLNQYNPTESPLVYNVDDVVQSINNILRTPLGSRMFLPEFGTQLEDLLFELMSDKTSLAIQSAIITGIRLWEPRVALKQATVFPNYVDGVYDVTVVFTIPALDGKLFEYQGQLAPKSKTAVIV